MSRTLALELNDLGVAVAGAPAVAESEPSPGWAVVEPDGGGLRVGLEAAGRIRLNPRLAHRSLWSDIALEPLPRPFPRGLSTADLAYAHLRSIWEGVEGGPLRGEVDSEARLLVAPASFTPGQLGLVLGIAESLERPFTGVVDSAVAAAATLEPAGSVVLDLELGRAVGTRVDLVEGPSGPALRRGDVLSRQTAGWNALLDRWARAVGRSFVATTRFDPLHAAESEQALFDSLPGWLEALVERDAVEATLRAGDREHAIVLTRGEIAAAVEPIYAGVVELARALGERADGGRLTVTDRLRRAPGLLDRLADLGFGEPHRLPPGAALDGALRHAELVHRPGDPESLWVTELPVAGVSSTDPSETSVGA